MNDNLRTKRLRSPLLYPAAALSLASLAWTTWSLVDLLGAGPWGYTVAGGADFIWGSVIVAEARGVHIPIGKKRRNLIPLFGWAALLIVATFLAWHGISEDSAAMAAAGPFLPLGAKVIWVIALADMRDPSELTDDEKKRLSEMERRILFEEAQHRIEMQRRTMHAELVMREVSTDFDIELMRQDRARELHRRRPMELEAASPAAVPGDAVGDIADERRDAPVQRPDSTSVAAPRPAADAVVQRDMKELRSEGISKAAAVRIVLDADPSASAPQIVKRLAHHGIDADAAYVRTVLSRINKQRTSTEGGYL